MNKLCLAINANTGLEHIVNTINNNICNVGLVNYT